MELISTVNKNIFLFVKNIENSSNTFITLLWAIFPRQDKTKLTQFIHSNSFYKTILVTIVVYKIAYNN